jgi:hypothetical protein
MISRYRGTRVNRSVNTDAQVRPLATLAGLMLGRRLRSR